MQTIYCNWWDAEEPRNPARCSWPLVRIKREMEEWLDFTHLATQTVD